jgi:hypothetical protein
MDDTLLPAFQAGRVVSIAPRRAVGWTHVLENGMQLPLSDEVAAALALVGVVYYSPWDGPNARVYCLCDGYTLEDVARYTV